MKTFSRRFTLIFLSVLVISFQLKAQKDNVWTEKQDANWFNSQDWLNGLQLIPHKSINKHKFAKEYHTNKERWDKAFAYLKENDLVSLKPGKYLVDGENVFATVTEGFSKDIINTKWESHRSYSDIHYVIKGKEKIGIAPVSKATIIKEYDIAKDIEFYTTNGKYYIERPNNFFLIFPGDAHRPGIKVDKVIAVKKLVIKIRKVE